MEQDTEEINPIEITLAYLEKESETFKSFTGLGERQRQMVKIDYLLDGLIELGYLQDVLQ